MRSPLAAYGIGLVHGVGGSAGIAVLLLAGIPGRGEAIAALALFAGATAVSMAVLSSGLGVALGLGPVQRRFVQAVPALAALAFAFGGVYSALALGSVL